MSATILSIARAPCVVFAAGLPIDGDRTLERAFAVGPFWSLEEMKRWVEGFAAEKNAALVHTMSCEQIDLRRLPDGIDEVVDPSSIFGQPRILGADLPLVLQSRGLPVRRISIRSLETR